LPDRRGSGVTLWLYSIANSAPEHLPLSDYECVEPRPLTSIEISLRSFEICESIYVRQMKKNLQ